jgi:SanA protein
MSKGQGRTALIALAVLLSFFVLVLLFPLALRTWVDIAYGPRIYTSPEEVPPHKVAIVFGAQVWGDQLSTILADRVEAAVALYRAGKVQKLLVTGDNRFVNYNEPAAMAAYARQRGVPDADIVPDYAGRRTYDSCYRAIHIFGLKDAILVTQNYHLDRALFTCNALGLDAVGLAADRRPYLYMPWFWLREVPATVRAWWDVYIGKPLPVLGDKIEIE